MLKSKIGLLTIGQSPREDILPELLPFLSPHLETVEVGLLDGLNFENINDLKPETTESQLITRLNDGSQVQLSERKICKLLPRAIHRMITERKVNAVGILCTHNFPKSDFSCPIIYPFDYLKFLVNFVLKIKNLGVIIPSNDQIEMTENKWETEKIIVEAKSPYNKSNSWRRIIQPLVQEKVEAIVLDCIGYKIRDKQTIQNLIPVPILLPSAILVFTINQLF
ncbi:MAG: AroM family protein [Candidatus Hermodarchaeota archaeon]